MELQCAPQSEIRGILATCEAGWVVDIAELFNSSSCPLYHTILSPWKQPYFPTKKIKTHHSADSGEASFQPGVKEEGSTSVPPPMPIEGAGDVVTPQTRNKRKRKQESAKKNDEFSTQTHAHIQRIVKKAYDRFRGEFPQVLERDEVPAAEGNAAPAKADDSLGSQFLSWMNMVASMKKFELSRGPVDVRCVDMDGDAFCRVVINEGKDEPYMLPLLGKEFVIPPESRFVMSDISDMEPLLQDSVENGGYSFIVMDPPWENRSVQRSKNYQMLPPHLIKELPIPQLASTKGSLIVVWVTNNVAFHSFVKKTLFKAWNVTYLATWYWLKIAQNHDMVVPLDSVHRKPYEPLIIGYRPSTDTEIGGRMPSIPDSLVICSIANKEARKPVLRAVMEEHLPEDGRCLELFARNLNKGWTSWGNEALLFQEMRHFRRSSDSNRETETTN